MEYTKNDMKMTKGVAILFMLLLHLFCRKVVNGLYIPTPLIHGVPLVYYIGLFGDACVPMYCFASGYGLFVSIQHAYGSIIQKNFTRILKLLINYWIILVLFISLGFFVGMKEIFPGSLAKFLMNFFVLSDSYNGAWWFLQIYIILVILSPVITRMVKKYNSITIVLISTFIYLVTYVQRIKHVVDFGNNSVVNMTIYTLVLLGTSQLPFIVGAVFAKDKIYSRIYININKLSIKNLLCIAGILVMVLIHSLYQSMIIAPITGIAFICFFNLLDKRVITKKVLILFGNHSTNLWLTHMFFYISIFPKITFAPKYPILIFCWLITMCLISSYIINLILKPLVRIIDRKLIKTSLNTKAVS